MPIAAVVQLEIGCDQILFSAVVPSKHLPKMQLSARKRKSLSGCSIIHINLLFFCTRLKYDDTTSKLVSFNLPDKLKKKESKQER